MRNLSYENQVYSQVHSNANHTHFLMKRFAPALILKQRQNATGKWPITCFGGGGAGVFQEGGLVREVGLF